LVEEKICFFGDAAEGEHKSIMILMVIITKIYLIFHHKPFIARTFHVALVEFAFLVGGTSTPRIPLTIKSILCSAIVKVVPVVDVSSTRAAAAVVGAGDGGDAAAGVNNDRLLLQITANIQVHIEIL